MVERGTKVIADLTKIIPRFADWVVHDNEGSTGGHGVGKEVVGLAETTVVGGDSAVIGPGAHHIESVFSLFE